MLSSKVVLIMMLVVIGIAFTLIWLMGFWWVDLLWLIGTVWYITNKILKSKVR